jgi:hypothetical protein
MNPITRFFNWLSGKPNYTITKNMSLNGVVCEKIYVFGKDREATLQEMLMVMKHPHFKLEGQEEGSGIRISTEEWNQRVGENLAASIQRVVRETAEKHPGLDVLAFAWPDSYPTVIAAIVTHGEFPNPFPTTTASAVTGFKAAPG